MGNDVKTAEAFSGRWIFDHAASDLTWPAPVRWEMAIVVTGDRVSVREAIEQRSAQRLAVSLDARFDGEFYPVTGSPLVDEIAYELRDACIHGLGRKAGALCMRDSVQIVPGDRLRIQFWLVLAAAEVPIGTGVFLRSVDPG